MDNDGCGLWSIILAGLACWGLYTGINYLNGTGGCDAHASQYSCWYLDQKANYDVYYWSRLDNDDEDDNKLIASVKGLPECRRRAISYARRIGEDWNERAYVCILVVDGKFKEKHRYIEG